MRRLYLRSKKMDMMSTIERCYYDADNGRVKLALDRLTDLEDEIGNDVHISYAEGTLYRDFLGQGIRAYQSFAKAMSLDSSHADSAFNAASLAPDETSFRRCAEISERLSPRDAEVLGEILDALDQGHSFFESIRARIEPDQGLQDKYGVEASLIEIALLYAEPGSKEELELRKRRAQLMRRLDSSEAVKRESMAEDFPAEERLALLEGLAELDRILALDEWDAENWNFKSAWSILLKRYPEAIVCADRAIKLRPDEYCRPYHNKATALWKLGRRDEAVASCKEALRQAEISNQLDEMNRLRSFLDEIQKYPQKVPAITDLVELQPVLSHIMKAADLTGKKELESMKLMKLTGTVFEVAEMAFQQRIGSLTPDADDATPYVPAMAQALSYMGPEACLGVLLVVAKKRESLVYENCMLATLYIAAHAEEIMQRDALRLLVLTLLAPALAAGHERELLGFYRRTILQVSAAATDELAQLDRLMRGEMGKMLPSLPGLLADQGPVDAQEIERTKQVILRKLERPIMVNNAASFVVPDLAFSPGQAPQAGGRPEDQAAVGIFRAGCGTATILFFAIGALRYLHVVQWSPVISVLITLIAGVFVAWLYAKAIHRNSRLP